MFAKLTTLAWSLLGNVVLLVVCGVLLARSHYLPQLAEKDQQIGQLQGNARVSSAVAAQQAKDQGQLNDLRAQLAAKGAAATVVYRDRIKRLPALPVDCAPGRDRQDALNDLIHFPFTTGEKSP